MSCLTMLIYLFFIWIKPVHFALVCLIDSPFFLLLQSDARKYGQGHKVVHSPFNKACDTLKKFRKKTKNKLVYDNEKEAHVRRN